MPNEEWGVKRLCPKCATRFYDLKNDPMTCPSCDFEFDLASLLDGGKAAAAKVKKEAEAAAAAVDAEEQVTIVTAVFAVVMMKRRTGSLLETRAVATGCRRPICEGGPWTGRNRSGPAGSCAPRRGRLGAWHPLAAAVVVAAAAAGCAATATKTAPAATAAALAEGVGCSGSGP